MANFLYWDYLVWFSYAAMPVVIFLLFCLSIKENLQIQIRKN